MIRREIDYFLGAVRFFTRVPVPAWVGHSAEALNGSARYFPLVGLLVGGVSAGVYVLASLIWPHAVAILLAMATSLLMTGAFHEDGLSDAVDGLGGGWEKQRILDIMKDSRVGSFGVVALWLALTAKFVLLSALTAPLVVPALVVGHGVSRWCSTLLLQAMDYVREDLQSKAKPLATRLGGGPLTFATLTVLPAFLGLPADLALAGLALALIATLWLAVKFQRWLGGYTGDCLGAVQQVSEIGFYLGLVVTWPA